MSTPSPQQVGREFVRQYYTLLHEAPLHLHRFYSEHSTFTHGGIEKPGEEEPPAIGQHEIHKKITSLNFRDCHTKIQQVDSHSTLGSGVVVQVTGELSNNRQPMRRFMQTFVLAPQSPKKYYVHNDIFRYQDEVFSDHESEEDADSEGELESPQKPDISGSLGSTDVSGTYPGSIGDHLYGDSNIGVIDPMSQMSLNGSSSLVGGEHPHIHSHHNQQSGGIEMEPVSQYAPVVSTTQELVVEDIGGSVIEVEQLTNGHHTLHETIGGPAIEEGLDETPTLDENIASVGIIESAPLQQQEQLAPLEAEPTEPAKFSWATLASRNTGMGIPKVGPAGPISNAPVVSQSKFGGPPKPKYGSPAAAPATEAVPPQPQRGPRNPRDDRAPGGRGGRGGMSFSQGGPPNRDRMARGGSKGPDGAPDSNQGQGFGSGTESDGGTIGGGRSMGGGMGGPGAPRVPGPMADRARYPDAHQLFVGNLPLDASEQELKEFFQEFGPVLELRINTKGAGPTGAKVPNFGFVVFDSAEPVQKALQNKPLSFRGDYRINVEEKKARDGNGGPMGGGGMGDNGGPAMRGRGGGGDRRASAGRGGGPSRGMGGRGGMGGPGRGGMGGDRGGPQGGSGGGPPGRR